MMVFFLGSQGIIGFFVEQLFADSFDSHRARDLARESSAHSIRNSHDDAAAVDIKLLALDDKFAVFLVTRPRLGVRDVEEKVIVLVALSDAADMRGGVYLNSEHNKSS